MPATVAAPVRRASVAEPRMKEPVLSLCVCTFAGAERVEDTLWSLICQSAGPDRYEIIVIENDTDAAGATQAVIDGLQGAAVAPRLVIEPKRGLSHARNRAIHESRGDYVFFIDDDATASPRLVEHFIHAIADHAPDVIGGNILPLFEVEPPPELGYAWWPQWSLKHFGDVDRWLGDGEYFLGTNIGARRSLLTDEGFDHRLGRRGETLLGGEERYLGESRFRRRFVSGAVVFHLVTAERMTPSYLVKRMYFGSLSNRLRSTHAPVEPSGAPPVAVWRARVDKALGQLALLCRKLGFALRIWRERRCFLRAQYAKHPRGWD